MTDTRYVHRIPFALSAALALAACATSSTSANNRRTPDLACAQQTVTEKNVSYRVFFAKNGAVQRYVLAGGSQNEENDHDALMALEARFGPAGVNAPPERIVAYKTGEGGMKIPLKTVDSCGRVTKLQ